MERLWLPASASAARVVEGYASKERRAYERYEKKLAEEAKRLAEQEAREKKRDREYADRNPRQTFLLNEDGSVSRVTSDMDERVRRQLERSGEVWASARAPRRYGSPGENVIPKLEPGTSAVPFRESDWADIRQERLAEEAELARS